MQHPMVEGGNGGVSLVHFHAVMSHPPFFLEVRTCRKKGILTAGQYGMWWFLSKSPDPIFCIRGAFLPLPKAHFVS